MNISNSPPLERDEIESTKKKKKQPKFQLGKFKDLIGFINEFMNWVASHLASRGELQGTVQHGRFS